MFTKLATLLAYALLVFAIFRIGIAFLVVDSSESVQRYLGSGTSGEAIDDALRTMFIAIVLGTIADISRTLKQLVLEKTE